VDTTLGPGLLRITLNGERTDQLATVLDAVTRAYLAESGRLEQAERAERLDRVTAAANEQEDELGRKKQALRDLTGTADDAAGTAGINPAARRAAEQLAHAESDLSQVRSELTRPQGDFDARRRKDPSAGGAVPDWQVEEQVNARLEKDVLDANQLTQIAALEQQIREFERVAVDPEAHTAPLRRRLEALKAAREARRNQLRAAVRTGLQEKARAEAQAALTDAQDRIAALKDRERLLAEQVQRLGAEAHPPRNPGPEAEKLRAEMARSEGLVKKLGEQAQALKIEMAAPPRVTLLQEAVATPRDDRGRLRAAGLAGLGVLACTLLGFSLWEFRARRISTPDEVAQGLGLRVLGALPRVRQRARGRPAEPGASPDVPWQNLLNESIDVTRTLLIHDTQSAAVQVVLVTSATEGEGKTTLASQLAASLARAGRKTLLLDGDLRKPAAHRLFDLPLEPGFCELVRGEVHIADVIRPTRLSRLWLIPAGLCDGHATQALAQDGLHGVFEELRGQFDFIVIDSCPVLPVADSLLIGQYVDGAIFSVLRDESRLPTVYAAHQRLAGLGIRMLGAVVNGTAGGAYGYRTRAAQAPVA
jgi:capsular exopolysaccharide synthesis family protein